MLPNKHVWFCWDKGEGHLHLCPSECEEAVTGADATYTIVQAAGITVSFEEVEVRREHDYYVTCDETAKPRWLMLIVKDGQGDLIPLAIDWETYKASPTDCLCFARDDGESTVAFMQRWRDENLGADGDQT